MSLYCYINFHLYHASPTISPLASWYISHLPEPLSVSSHISTQDTNSALPIHTILLSLSSRRTIYPQSIPFHYQPYTQTRETYISTQTVPFKSLLQPSEIVYSSVLFRPEDLVLTQFLPPPLWHLVIYHNNTIPIVPLDMPPYHTESFYQTWLQMN